MKVAVALAVYVNLVPLFFSSLGQLILLSPPLLAVMPLLAPVMAVWNAFNPDVPLVFWRWVGKCGRGLASSSACLNVVLKRGNSPHDIALMPAILFL